MRSSTSGVHGGTGAGWTPAFFVRPPYRPAARQGATAALRYRVLQGRLQRPRHVGVRRPPVRWVGITLCLLWAANQLSRLITWLRQWGQRDPLSQAFHRELHRRGLVLR